MTPVANIEPAFSLPDNSDRLVRYLVAEHLAHFRLPAGITGQKRAGKIASLRDEQSVAALTISLTPRAAEGEASPQIHVHAEGTLLRRVNPTALLAALVSDSAVQQVLFVWGFPTPAFARTGKAA